MLLDEASGIDMQPLMPSTNILWWQLEQEVRPETSPVELKQLPLGQQYVFLNGDHETPVTISDRLSIDET
jgi:hypothetical protein